MLTSSLLDMGAATLLTYGGGTTSAAANDCGNTWRARAYVRARTSSHGGSPPVQLLTIVVIRGVHVRARSCSASAHGLADAHHHTARLLFCVN